MDRGLWASAVAGFAFSALLFSPLDNAAAWLAAWQKPLNPAETRRAEVMAATLTPPRRVSSARRNPVIAIAARRAVPPAAIARAPRLIDPKEQLARTIDPAKRPDWYLIDPTLKRGDVLFLADKVVVFRGRTIGRPADYVPVKSARMFSRKDRRIIERMALRPAPGGIEPQRDHSTRVAAATTSASQGAD